MLIADDHASVRTGIRMVLERAGFDVCSEHGDAASAVAGAVADRPDLCLLDVRMPGGGVAAAAAISERLPEMPIVMLTVVEGDDDLFEALRAGASGYLLKDMQPEGLADALRGALRGEAALPRALVARVLREFGGRRGARPAGSRGLPRLTDRQIQVLELLRDGQTSATIAARLGVSPVTVRRHVSEILRKLRVPSRQAAVNLIDEQRADSH